MKAKLEQEIQELKDQFQRERDNMSGKDQQM